MIQNMTSFAIPIAFGSLENKEINSLIMNDVTSPEFTTKFKMSRTGINVIQTEFGLETQYESIKTLKNILDEELKDYMSWCGVQSSFTTTRYWANINKLSFAYHIPHIHCFSRGLFGGVYFPMSLSTVENHITISETPEPGSLVLLDPLQSVKMGQAYSENINRYKFFGSPICVQPKESHFVVFPNYLQHMTTPTEEDNKLRISIAFDVELRNL